MNVLAPDWEPRPPSGVAIGVFDGVHRGHAAVIEGLVAVARGRDLQVGVLTFDPHPVEVLAPEKAPPLLTSLSRRVELLEGLGVDWVGILDLADIRLMSPREFISHVLVERAGCRVVSVGDDFRFGHERAGDVGLLRSVGAEQGFEVAAVSLLGDGEGVISSTRIRHLLTAGRVTAAAALLGRPHRLSGPVIAGDSRGRRLGFPTANMVPPGRLVVPSDGIYAVRVEGAARGGGVASLGVRPTFGSEGTRLLEVNVFDFDGDLYGAILHVDFIERLRGEERFDSVDALVAQMEIDAEMARAALADR